MRNQFLASIMCICFICSVPFTQQSKELLPKAMLEILSDIHLLDIELEETLEIPTHDHSDKEKESNSKIKNIILQVSDQSDCSNLAIQFYELHFLRYSSHLVEVPSPPPRG